MKNIIFYLGMGAIFTYELDAMSNHEWRVLPLTSWLPDEHGMAVFLLIHIPLFAVLIALVASTNTTIRIRSQIGISIFLVIHGLLHLLFIGSTHYEFSSIGSNTLIFASALLGLLYLILEYAGKHKISSSPFP